MLPTKSQNLGQTEPICIRLNLQGRISKVQLLGLEREFLEDQQACLSTVSSTVLKYSTP